MMPQTLNERGTGGNVISQRFTSKVFELVEGTFKAPNSNIKQKKERVLQVLRQEHPDLEESILETVVDAGFEAHERGWFK